MTPAVFNMYLKLGAQEKSIVIQTGFFIKEMLEAQRGNIIK